MKGGAREGKTLTSYADRNRRGLTAKGEGGLFLLTFTFEYAIIPLSSRFFGRAFLAIDSRIFA